MISQQPSQTVVNPIERMAGALKAFFSIKQFNHKQEEIQQLLNEIIDCDAEILQWIDEDKIDPYLNKTFFAFLGYFGLLQTIKKLEEKNKCSFVHLCTAITYATKRHDLALQKEKKHKQHLMEHLYKDLDETTKGKIPKGRHFHLDSALDSVREQTREYLMPKCMASLEKEEISLNEFCVNLLSDIYKNYDVVFMTKLLDTITLPASYRDSLLVIVIQGLMQGRNSPWRWLFFLYVEAGGNINMAVPYAAKLNNQIMMANFHLLHLVLLLDEPPLYFMLKPYLKAPISHPTITEAKEVTMISTPEPLAIFDFDVTILHLAAYFECNEVIDDILQQQLADVNARTRSGKTALMIAAANDNLECTQKLLTKANPTLITPQGEAAWTYASEADIILCLARGFCEWELKRANVIKNLQKAKAKTGIELEKSALKTELSIPDFPIVNAEFQLFRLFEQMSHFYFKVLMHPDGYKIDDMDKSENKYIELTLNMLEKAKHKVCRDEFNDRILKLVDRIVPYLGYFGCKNDYVRRLLNIVNYDMQIFSSILTYAVPNRSQNSSTRGLDRFIDHSEVLKVKYEHLVIRHTRLNKMLSQPRRELRKHLFEWISKRIKNGISNNEFDHLVEGCAFQQDTQCLAYIFDEMLNVKSNDLLKRHIILLKAGPYSDEAEEERSSTDDYIIKYYFDVMQSKISQIDIDLEESSGNESSSSSSTESEISNHSTGIISPASSTVSTPEGKKPTAVLASPFQNAVKTSALETESSQLDISETRQSEQDREIKPEPAAAQAQTQTVPSSSTKSMVVTLQATMLDEKISDEDLLTACERDMTNSINHLLESDNFDALYTQKNQLNMKICQQYALLEHSNQLLAQAITAYQLYPSKNNYMRWQGLQHRHHVEASILKADLAQASIKQQNINQSLQFFLQKEQQQASNKGKIAQECKEFLKNYKPI